MILAFCSPVMYSGKSTAAQYLVDEYGFALVKFAGPLKGMLRVLLRECGVGASIVERCVEGDLKEVTLGDLGRFDPGYAYAMRAAMGTLPEEVEMTDGAVIESLYKWGLESVTPHATPRRLMQTLGTEWGRNAIHPQLWVLLARDACMERRAVAIDDMRFLNEYDMVHALGGFTYRIVRPDAPVTASAGHVSEGELDRVAMPEIWNTGSVQDLYKSLDYLVTESR